MSIRTILTATAGCLALAVAGTFLLPSTVTVERKQVVSAEQAEIFALLTSNAGFQRFNPYKERDANLSITLTGPERGIGSGFAFDGAEGTGTQVITSLTDNQSVTMEIDLGSMGKPIQQFELKPMAGGTEVTWRVTSDFGMNPIGRVFGLFMNGMLGPVYERGLEKLDETVKAA